jgi:hypothetical protein
VGGNPETKTDPTGLDGGLFGGLVSVVSTMVQTVAPAAVQVVLTAAGASSMVSDVQTSVSTVRGGGSPLAVAMAFGDLALNVGLDASMLVGAGEGLRAAYVGLHAAEDVGEHLAVEGIAHATEGAAAHEAEDAAAHEAEQATTDALESGAESCGLSFAAGTLVKTPQGQQPIASLKVGDTVTAYDPQTGKATSEPVTRRTFTGCPRCSVY